MVRLKEICKVDWGNTNLTKAAYTEGGEYLGVSATGCDGKFNYYDFEAYTPVISAIGANCGKMFLPQRKFVAIKNTITLVPHDCIDGKYLYYAMINNRIPKRGGGQPFISKSDTENYEIPCPSLSIQREIVRIFDILSSIIKSRQQQLQKLDELVKARFVELFGDPRINPNKYPVCQLSDYIVFLTSGSRGWAQYCANDGTEWFITIKNVKDCHIETDNMQPINAPDNAEAKRTRVQEGDLLISITADLGRTGVVTKEIAEHGAYINQHLTCIRLKQDVLNPLYVAYFMESPAGKEQFESKNQSAVKAGLNFNSINSLRLMVPPLDDQNAFVDFIKQTDKSKAVIQKALDKAQLLFDSLMQRYFS